MNEWFMRLCDAYCLVGPYPLIHTVGLGYMCKVGLQVIEINIKVPTRYSKSDHSRLQDVSCGILVKLLAWLAFIDDDIYGFASSARVLELGRSWPSGPPLGLMGLPGTHDLVSLHSLTTFRPLSRMSCSVTSFLSYFVLY
jgi:hypothetical protein